MHFLRDRTSKGCDYHGWHLFANWSGAHFNPIYISIYFPVLHTDRQPDHLLYWR
jgi:hypothetical protein